MYCNFTNLKIINHQQVQVSRRVDANTTWLGGEQFIVYVGIRKPSQVSEIIRLGYIRQTSIHYQYARQFKSDVFYGLVTAVVTADLSAVGVTPLESSALKSIF